MFRSAMTILGGLGWALAGPAEACRAPQFHDYLVRTHIPSGLRPDLTILDLEFQNIDPRDSYQMSTAVVQARVRRVVRGSFPGKTISVRLLGSSCSFPFQNDTAGLVVGLLKPEKGRLLFYALSEHTRDARRASERVSR